MEIYQELETLMGISRPLMLYKIFLWEQEQMKEERCCKLFTT